MYELNAKGMDLPGIFYCVVTRGNKISVGSGRFSLIT